MLWASSLGLAAGARTEPASLSKASATSAMFFDSAVALQRANPTLVLNDAKQAVAKAREDRNDLAGALCRLGLLEFDLGHFDKAHKALEEARQLLEAVRKYCLAKK
jgi:hypothetical protein